MSIKHSPYTGMILRCDFTGFREPEMVKIRPVIVISPRPERINKRTCIVVALSTTEPSPHEKHHVKISLPDRVPDNLKKDCWVKGDMIYSVSFDRLDLYRIGREKDGKRRYYFAKLSKEEIRKVRKAVSYAIGITIAE